jgi:hypothetical protein
LAGFAIITASPESGIKALFLSKKHLLTGCVKGYLETLVAVAA